MSRVRKGRFGRSRFSCRSHGLCSPPAVSSTVIKLGVCHQLRFLRLQVAASGCRSGFSYSTPHRYLRKEGSLRLLSQPASHRKETLEVTHLKKLAERTDFGNLSQLRRMFVLAFPAFQEVQNYVKDSLSSRLDVSKSLSL